MSRRSPRVSSRSLRTSRASDADQDPSLVQLPPPLSDIQSIVMSEEHEMGRKTPRSFLWSGGSFARTNQPASKGGVHSLFAFLIQITRIIVHALEETFLPAGYPDSVPSEYSTFQTWDSIQAMCSYLRGVLASKAMFEAVGVGNENATALAATVTWIMRDGAHMLGSLIFARWGGSRFDRDVKFWRLYADVINDVGLTLEMCAPLCGPYLKSVASIASVCTAMCGVSAGATRAAILAHFALQHNLADLSAKESSQETAVSLIGLLCGLAITSFLAVGREEAWIAFAALTLLHVFANWRAVSCLTLRTVNENRAAVAIDIFLADSSLKETGVRPEAIPFTKDLSPVAIAAFEPLVPACWWSPIWSIRVVRAAWRTFFCVPHSRYNVDIDLRLGCGASELCTVVSNSGKSLPRLVSYYQQEKYIAAVAWDPSSWAPRQAVLAVAFLPGVTTADKLKAYFQACAFHIGVQQLRSNKPSFRYPALTPSELNDVLDDAYLLTAKLFPAFTRAMRAAGWLLEQTTLGGGGMVVSFQPKDE